MASINMSRTDRYRDMALNMVYSDPPEMNYLTSKAILSEEFKEERISSLKRSYIECYILDNYSVNINSLELLVGRFNMDFELTEEQRKTIAEADALINKTGISIVGLYPNSTNHRVIDYEKLLNRGIKEIIFEIDEKLSQISYGDPDAFERESFYIATKNSLLALCKFAERYRLALLDLSEKESDPQRKQELNKMAANFEKAPYEPCTHFYEALQSMWFVQFCMRLASDIVLTGRIDNYLFPFYDKDIKSGCITKEFAFELIEQLYYKNNELYGAWPASVMLGGVDRDGNTVCNDITYMCIRAIGTTRLVNPSVSLCYRKDTPDDLLRLCVEMISQGFTKPSIFNDEVIQEGLRNAGVSTEDARYYVHSTCVEITPIATSNILVASPYINISKAFETVLAEHSPDNFEELFSLIKKEMKKIIDKALKAQCRETYIRAHYYASPLASAFLEGCIEKGKDCGNGGTKYNFIYPCFPGFVTVVDSLQAIKTAVYEKKAVTLEQIFEMCKSNFENNERWRQYLLNICDKFGNDVDATDSIACELYEFFKDTLSQYRTCLNGTFHPSYFAWVMHGQLGKETCATPDGRRAGEALSENLGAMQGRDKNGPLSVMRSIEKIDQKSGIGGIATNFRFSSKMLSGDDGKNALMNFIRVFMANRCFEIQLNVVDQKDLLEAKSNPEKFGTLLVRVAGYSDYFVNLDPVIQDEIIKRTEHSMI